MRYLLDSCVISEASRPRPNLNVLSWLDSIAEDDLFVPAIVFGELRKGVERCRDEAKKVALTKWLNDCRNFYGGRIVPFDYEAADLWGERVADLQKRGITPPVIDSQIAATALRHGMTLVTRNVHDMLGFDIKLFNPFDA